MHKYFFINGKIQPISKPAVMGNDIGLLRGYGVFDFGRTYNGKVFHFEDHYKRFQNSAQMLDLKVPAGKEKILGTIKELLKKNRVKGDASFRLVLTGGPSDDGMSFKKPTLMAFIEDLHPFTDDCYKKGIKLITFEHERILPESKNINYIHAVRLQKLAKQKGASEILFTAAGDQILECSRSNFFIFKGATLMTAKGGILKGTTRKIVMKLARKKFRVEERDLYLKDLDSATEAFITGVNKPIAPVVTIDSTKIGDGKVGENTKWLMEEFKKYTNKYK